MVSVILPALMVALALLPSADTLHSSVSLSSNSVTVMKSDRATVSVLPSASVSFRLWLALS